MNIQLTIEGLKEFRADLRRSHAHSPRLLTQAIKAAGVPFREAAMGLYDRASDTGFLRDQTKIRARATSGFLANTAPYAQGAEFGLHGKWRGFRKYGARADRFIFPALEKGAPAAFEVMTEQLSELLTILGWYREA